MAGGYTMMLPKEEKNLVLTKKELLAEITGLLGGRVSEEMFLGEISTGASDDFKKATRIARGMEYADRWYTCGFRYSARAR